MEIDMKSVSDIMELGDCSGYESDNGSAAGFGESHVNEEEHENAEDLAHNVIVYRSVQAPPPREYSKLEKKYIGLEKSCSDYESDIRALQGDVKLLRNDVDLMKKVTALSREVEQLRKTMCTSRDRKEVGVQTELENSEGNLTVLTLPSPETRTQAAQTETEKPPPRKNGDKERKRSGNFICAVCVEAFIKVSLLKKHMKESHYATLHVFTIGCTKCGKYFKGPYARKAHTKHLLTNCTRNQKRMGEHRYLTRSGTGILDVPK